MLDRNEFDKDKAIDPGQLDVEACRQAELFFKYAEKSISAKAEVDRMKFALDVLEAKLRSTMMDSPEKFGLSKTTENAITAAVKTHKDYTIAYEAYLKAKEVSSLLDVAREAMEQKKRMIEVLVTLHGQQYFAGPSVPHDLVSTWREYQQGISEQVNQRQAQGVRKRVRKEG
jgi:hypothetical protein